MKTYLVGGAVRDKLLKLPQRDKDWVVVGACAEDLLEKNFLPVGKGFPVFLHPRTREEYALARTEKNTAPGYTGFEFNTSKEVTLEEDLRRRDLTINAIAQDHEGLIIDPYHGCKDIEDRVLRHVSPAFSEDPLRVLRVARFASRYAWLGFRIAEETMLLMKNMVSDGELSHLVAERVWQEIENALGEKTPVVFFKTLRDCGALKVILPEVDALFGVPQPRKYHPEIDTGVHTFMSLERATLSSDDPVVRFATLVHDLGKAMTPKDNWPHHHRHEKLGIDRLRRLAKRLKIPKEFYQIARLVCLYHTKCHRLMEARAVTLLALLESLDAFRRPTRMDKFLLACQADANGRTGFEESAYPQSDRLRQALRAAKGIDTAELTEIRNCDIKEIIKKKRIFAIEEILRHRSSNPR